MSRLCFLVISFVFFLSFESTAQIAIGTNTLDPSAMLQVESNEAGVLMTRLSEADKANIPTPIPNGLMIFNTDEERFQYFFDGNWFNLGVENTCDYILSGEEFDISLEKGQSTSINLDILPSIGNAGDLTTSFSSSTSNLVITGFSVTNNITPAPANQSISFTLDASSIANTNDTGVVIIEIASECGVTKFVRVNITVSGCDFTVAVDDSSKSITKPTAGTNQTIFNLDINQAGTTSGTIDAFNIAPIGGLTFSFANIGCSYDCNPTITVEIDNTVVAPSMFSIPVDIVSSCGTTKTINLQVTIEEFARDCKQILENEPSSLSGQYTIDVDGDGGLDEIDCYCDMTTEGGGWTLVLNYTKGAGLDPNSQYRSTTLPLLNPSSVLGDNEFNTVYWGHAIPSLLGLLDIDEVMFYGESSGHGGVLHFRHNQQDMIDYFQSGVGGINVTDLRNNFTPIGAHNANLPGTADRRDTGRGNDAMLRRPFRRNNGEEWHINGGNGADDWEMDDNPNDESNSNIFRIWVR